MSDDMVERLRDEAITLSGIGIDRGSVDASISAMLADEAADRIGALQARLAEVEADKRWIMEERDRTFALMLSRAEAAEARVKELEAQTAPEVAALLNHMKRLNDQMAALAALAAMEEEKADE